MGIHMLHPVRPQEFSTDPEAEDLFGLDGEAPEDEGGWDQALAEADKQQDKDCVDDNEHANTDDSVKDVSPDVVCQPCKVDEADDPWAPVQLAQQPSPLTDVQMPSRAEIARHNLTRLPFR